MHDPGEPPRKGRLLVARHGKGRFIYTGLAFFRQLPAGVPGAYRLFANLLDHARLTTPTRSSRAAPRQLAPLVPRRAGDARRAGRAAVDCSRRTDYR